MQATPAVTVRTRGYGVEADGGALQVEYHDDAVYDAIRDAAVKTKAAIIHLKRRVLSLEDI